jgi:cytochrome c553
VQHVPNSAAGYTLGQIANAFGVPDWHPGDHPPMPGVVAHGRRPAVLACGYCHLPTGLGRPENASLAGLPSSYIVQQIADFKNGARKTADPRSEPVQFMVQIAKNLSDAEIKAAADYFSRLKRTPWIRVVETDTVPQTKPEE